MGGQTPDASLRHEVQNSAFFKDPGNKSIKIKALLPQMRMLGLSSPSKPRLQHPFLFIKLWRPYSSPPLSNSGPPCIPLLPPHWLLSLVLGDLVSRYSVSFLAAKFILASEHSHLNLSLPKCLQSCSDLVTSLRLRNSLRPTHGDNLSQTRPSKPHWLMSIHLKP